MATKRYGIWRAAIGAFIAINLGGTVYAAIMGEPMHAAVHAVLLVLGIAAYSTLRTRRADMNALPQETVDRLKHLEESVDALAIGVERVGEAQRYQTKILDEKKKTNQAASPPKPAAPPGQSKKEES